jgi:hypothetical protein
MKLIRFYKLSKFLKSTLNPLLNIQVKRASLPNGIDGDCRFKNNKFLIRIEKKLPEYYAIDVLLHEISHVLSWEKEYDFHGIIWGKSYSVVYRKFLEWLENEKNCKN